VVELEVESMRALLKEEKARLTDMEREKAQQELQIQVRLLSSGSRVCCAHYGELRH
jgi:regulator of replication initiation timing